MTENQRHPLIETPPTNEPVSRGDAQNGGSTASVRKNTPSTPVEGIVLVGVCVSLWWPAFTLGAWGTLFFDQLMTVWAAATGALVVVLIQPRGFKYRLIKAAALAVPSLWVLLSFILASGDQDTATILLDLLGAAVAILGLPFTAWVLIRMMWPGFGEGLTVARRWVVLGAIGLIAALSYQLGVHQAGFLTCEDFAISGNSNPPGCTPTDDPVPTTAH